jgi:hypothetical protein
MSTIESVSQITVRDTVVIHGAVTYTRHDGRELTVPFADISSMEGEKIKDYLIFIDNTKL